MGEEDGPAGTIPSSLPPPLETAKAGAGCARSSSGQKLSFMAS